jgi:hypothetical protein
MRATRFRRRPADYWLLAAGYWFYSTGKEVEMVINKKFRQEAKSVGASVVGRDGIRAVAQRSANREIAMLIDRIAEVRIKSEGRISKPTALLIDRSSAEAIELGNRLARLISAALIDRVARLHVFAFDSAAYPMNAASGSVAGLAEALKTCEAPSQADPGAALGLLRKSRLAVEQIVLVIGACEREMPKLAGAYTAYRSDLGLTPPVIIVGGRGVSNSVEQELRRAGAPVIPHSFNGDPSSVAALIPTLCRPSKLDLLMGLLESGAARGAH